MQWTGTIWTIIEESHITLNLIETYFDTFANRADPDQASGSILFAYDNMIRYDLTLVFLSSISKRESLFI